MARIRYLNPKFFKDEDLADLPFWIRLLFEGLWNIADREGRLKDRPRWIKIEVFPYDNVDIDEGLQELSKIKPGSNRPFIQRYEANGQRYIQIVAWHEYQKPHHTERPSVIPPPTILTNNNNINNIYNNNIKIMGMGSVHGVNEPLKNGEITVKTKQAKQKEREPTSEIGGLILKTSFINSLKEVYNGALNVESEILACITWHKTKGRREVRDWNKAIRNWLKIGYEGKGVVGLKGEEKRWNKL